MRRGLGPIAVICFLILSMLELRTARAASQVRVAATVAPVHSLVAMVTADITEPSLIVRPGASPHSYALKPSEARALDEADVVIWVGEALEPWMAKAVTTLATAAAVIDIFRADGRLVRRLEHRTDDGGHGRATWDGRDMRAQPVPAGVYPFRIRVGGQTVQLGKLVRLQ